MRDDERVNEARNALAGVIAEHFDEANRRSRRFIWRTPLFLAAGLTLGYFTPWWLLLPIVIVPTIYFVLRMREFRPRPCHVCGNPIAVPIPTEKGAAYLRRPRWDLRLMPRDGLQWFCPQDLEDYVRFQTMASLPRSEGSAPDETPGT